MNDIAESQQVACEHIPKAEPSFCRMCPTWASCVAICDELEALLRGQFDTHVSVSAIAFSDLGVSADELPSDGDRRLEKYKA
jgi:hypothetical protein